MITRLVVVDDIGDKRSGTAITAAWWTLVQDMIDARWSMVTLGNTGTVHNLNISEADVVVFNNVAPLTVTGILAPAAPGKIAKPLRLFSAGTAPVYLAHFDGGSSGANKLFNRATSGPTAIVNGGCATYFHNSGAWLLTHHDQGAWIAPTLTAAMFTATTGTFLPNLGASSLRYFLSNHHLLVQLSIAAAAVSNPTANLFVQLPYVAAVSPFMPVIRAADNGVVGQTMCKANAASASLAFWSNLGGAGWAASAGSTALDGHVVVEVV